MGSDGIHQSNLLIMTTAPEESWWGTKPYPAGLGDLVPGQLLSSELHIAGYVTWHPDTLGHVPSLRLTEIDLATSGNFWGHTPPCQSSPIPNRISCFPEARSHGTT